MPVLYNLHLIIIFLQEVLKDHTFLAWSLPPTLLSFKFQKTENNLQ